MQNRLAAAMTVAIAIAATGFLYVARPAFAQSPSPSWKMTDVNTFHGFPTGYNAAMVEGGGMLGSQCDQTPYTKSEVEDEAVSWIKSGLQTIIEVTLSSSCDGSISDYENLLSSMSSYIKSHITSSQFTRDWGGFMLDEEPWYWYSSASRSHTDFDSINSYVTLNLSYSTFSPYTELGDASGWWTQAQYNDVAALNGGSPAPQVYNTVTTDQQNSLVKSAGVSTLVTCDPNDSLPNPYNTCSGAYGTIDGSPFDYSEWGNGYWYNVFQPA